MKLSSEQLLEQNIQFLREHMRPQDILSFVYSRKGNPHISIEMSGKEKPLFYSVEKEKILLHSSRDPEGEARRQVDTWAGKQDIDWGGMITVIGMAGAYHLDEIAKRLQPGATLFVIDPNPVGVWELLKYVDLSRLEKGNDIKLLFCLSDEMEKIAYSFRATLAMEERFGLNLFIHPGLKRANTKKFENLSRLLLKEFSLDAMNRKTRAMYSMEWQKNAISNLPNIFTEAPVNAIKGIFQGKTALIAAAGPSLNEAIPYIKEVRERCVLLAVGTALAPLIKAGIEPDFSVSVDCSGKVIKQYKGLCLDNVFLIAEPVVMPPVFDLFKGRTFLMKSPTLPAFYAWLEKLIPLPDSLRVGGTVALTAIDSAVYMGCKNIVLTGLDLALAADGTSHAKNSMYDDNNKKEEQETVEVAGSHGKNVLTTKQFKSYIDIMSSYIDTELKNEDVRVFNAAACGASLGDVPVIHAYEIPSVVGTHIISRPAKDMLAEKHNKCVPMSPANSLKAMKEAEYELKKTEELSQRASALCSRNTQADIMEELKKIDTRIKKYKNAPAMTEGAIYRAIMKIFSDKEASPMAKNTEFYSELKEICEWTGRYLHGAIEKLEKKINEKDNKTGA